MDGGYFNVIFKFFSSIHSFPKTSEGSILKFTPPVILKSIVGKNKIVTVILRFHSDLYSFISEGYYRNHIFTTTVVITTHSITLFLFILNHVFGYFVTSFRNIIHVSLLGCLPVIFLSSRELQLDIKYN